MWKYNYGEPTMLRESPSFVDGDRLGGRALACRNVSEQNVREALSHFLALPI